MIETQPPSKRALHLEEKLELHDQYFTSIHQRLVVNSSHDSITEQTQKKVWGTCDENPKFFLQHPDYHFSNERM